jgi:hypothetical protein
MHRTAEESRTVGFRSPAPNARPEEGGPSSSSRTLGPFLVRRAKARRILKRPAECQYCPGARKPASELF